MKYWLFVIELLLLSFHKQIHAKIEKHGLNKYVYYYLVSIPLFLMTYLDIMYDAYSLRNLGVPNKYNDRINYLLNLLGSYGMIQILAQDSGLKTGEIQRNTVQQSLLFSLIAIGMAFSVTNNRSQAMIAVLYYYHLKYVISNNKTSPVCFEDV